MFQNKVFIALGTNVGNWKNNFNHAFKELNKIGKINKFSSIYLTKPYGFNDQNPYYNTAIELFTFYQPIKLFEKIITIEKILKKNKKIINGPRKIDLDIIFFNNLVFKNNKLIIPHPRAHLRDFVLYPINEINPYANHPIKKETVNQLKKKLKKQYIIKKIFRGRGSILIY